MNSEIVALITALVTAIVMALAVYFFGLVPRLRRELKSADDLREQLQKEAEVQVGNAVLEAKQEALRQREKLEEEYREKHLALVKQEERIAAKEEALDARRDQLASREDAIMAQQRQIADKAEAIDAKLREAQSELEQIASMNRDQAVQTILARVEAEAREQGLRRAKEIENDIIQDAERRSKKVLLESMQRLVVDYVTEATLAVVELPSEDMKGRIIGREGRNIRAFEQVTGVDLIIDETPEAVVISCFDPVRRESARLTLMNLMVDGRIHPGRIEELYEKAQAEVERTILESGEKACERANIAGLPARVVETMGRLRFRTSYAQNVLDHSVETSRLCASLASELGLNAEVAKRAGFLHDIGKALGPEWEGPHALTGMEFLRQMGEKEAVLHAVGAHHHEIEPETAEAIVVIIADTISAARPGARRENLENYLKRLTNLEQLANSFPGVERSYAVQAGREVRLIVRPNEVDDLGAARIANEVARKIENELEYAGQIKVTVIRETRAQEVAK